VFGIAWHRSYGLQFRLQSDVFYSRERERTKLWKIANDADGLETLVQEHANASVR